MGYMRHHAIVVTGGFEPETKEAHAKAVEIFGSGLVSGILASPVNSYWSFFICPDGSKEGWDQSDLGDDRRNAFIEYLDKAGEPNGFCPVDWVEVQYADEERETKVCRHSDEESR